MQRNRGKEREKLTAEHNFQAQNLIQLKEPWFITNKDLYFYKQYCWKSVLLKVKVPSVFPEFSLKNCKAWKSLLIFSNTRITVLIISVILLLHLIKILKNRCDAISPATFKFYVFRSPQLVKHLNFSILPGIFCILLSHSVTVWPQLKIFRYPRMNLWL